MKLYKNIFFLFLIALPQNNYCLFPKNLEEKINRKVILGSMVTFACILIAFFAYKNYKNGQQEKKKNKIPENPIENNDDDTEKKDPQNWENNIEKKINDDIKKLNDVANTLGIKLNNEDKVDVKKEEDTGGNVVENIKNEVSDDNKSNEEDNNILVDDEKNEENDHKEWFERFRKKRIIEAKNQITLEEDIDKKINKLNEGFNKTVDDKLNEIKNKNNNNGISSDSKQEEDIIRKKIDENETIYNTLTDPIKNIINDFLDNNKIPYDDVIKKTPFEQVISMSPLIKTVEEIEDDEKIFEKFINKFSKNPLHMATPNGVKRMELLSSLLRSRTDVVYSKLILYTFKEYIKLPWSACDCLLNWVVDKELDLFFVKIDEKENTILHRIAENKPIRQTKHILLNLFNNIRKKDIGLMETKNSDGVTIFKSLLLQDKSVEHTYQELLGSANIHRRNAQSYELLNGTHYDKSII